jgi:predicted nucleic acid-binding protein
VTSGQDKGFISQHSIAEIYAGLTRVPVQPRIHPAEAKRSIIDNIVPHFEIVPIRPEHYMQALEVVGDAGWIGGKIYDALLLACAAGCDVERIYTFNLADFRQLAPAALQEKICVP